jgi:hypothetical protein
MSHQPDGQVETLEPKPFQAGLVRRVSTLLVAGVGLLCLVPLASLTILDWRNSGIGTLLGGLPCFATLAAPFFIAAWRLRNGPLSEHQRRFLSRLSTTTLAVLLAVDAILIILLVVRK